MAALWTYVRHDTPSGAVPVQNKSARVSEVGGLLRADCPYIIGRDGGHPGEAVVHFRSNIWTGNHVPHRPIPMQGGRRAFISDTPAADRPNIVRLNDSKRG